MLILCIAFIYSWLAERRDRDRLDAELAATKQLLSAANNRQHDRDAQLNQTLAALSSEKRAVRSPAQILRDLPHQLPLPAPITLQSPTTTPTTTNVATPGAPPGEVGRAAPSPASPSEVARDPDLKPSAPDALIPSEDLKPLYDFVLDCKACQARLGALQSDLADEKSKTAALTKERDEALQVARGGSDLRRIRRAAKWFVIGAATGAIAAKTAH